MPRKNRGLHAVNSGPKAEINPISTQLQSLIRIKKIHSDISKNRVSDGERGVKNPREGGALRLLPIVKRKGRDAARISQNGHSAAKVRTQRDAPILKVDHDFGSSVMSHG
jgi:hypothetical protein